MIYILSERNLFERLTVSGDLLSIHAISKFSIYRTMNIKIKKYHYIPSFSLYKILVRRYCCHLKKKKTSQYKIRFFSIFIYKNDKMYIFTWLQHGNMCICGILHREWFSPYIFFTFERYQVNNTECNIDCFGNRGEKCGGNSTYSMYNILAGKQTYLKLNDRLKIRNFNM